MQFRGGRCPLWPLTRWDSATATLPADGVPAALQGSVPSNSIGGSSDGIRRALRSKGHERLMRIVHMLTCEWQSGSNSAS